jgi:hypothetical protein
LQLVVLSRNGPVFLPTDRYVELQRRLHRYVNQSIEVIVHLSMTIQPLFEVVIGDVAQVRNDCRHFVDGLRVVSKLSRRR